MTTEMTQEGRTGVGATGRIAFVALGVFLLGLLVIAGATVWSAAEYNTFEAAGRVEESPTWPILTTAVVGVILAALGLLGAVVAAALLIIRSRRTA